MCCRVENGIRISRFLTRLLFGFQVYTRIEYLKYTVHRLSEIDGIEDVLLIFSHGYFDEQINELIKRIDYCKTAQIFFPYSMQVYTNTFPGLSPDDCPEKITRKECVENNYWLLAILAINTFTVHNTYARDVGSSLDGLSHTWLKCITLTIIRFSHEFIRL